MSNYPKKFDVAYLMQRASVLAYQGMYANIEEFNRRVKEVYLSLNPSLDTSQYFKDYVIKSYNLLIADTADEALAIAASLIGFDIEDTELASALYDNFDDAFYNTVRIINTYGHAKYRAVSRNLYAVSKMIGANHLIDVMSIRVDIFLNNIIDENAKKIEDGKHEIEYQESLVLDIDNIDSVVKLNANGESIHKVILWSSNGYISIYNGNQMENISVSELKNKLKWKVIYK